MNDQKTSTKTFIVRYEVQGRSVGKMRNEISGRQVEPSIEADFDMATDEAWTNLPGGPSESRFSKFYRSDIPLWLDGEYKRLSAQF